MVKKEVVVLGAGMVGTCAALELATRGHAVTLMDRRAPGEETSYGNAGVIQREAVQPYAFPRSVYDVLRIAIGASPDVRYSLRGLAEACSHLNQYRKFSQEPAYTSICNAYAWLISHATSSHAPLIQASGSGKLVSKQGIRFLYRSQRRLEEAIRNAARLSAIYGIGHIAQDATGVRLLEPALHGELAGAVHWTDSWSVSNPGELVKRYFELFLRMGGTFQHADANGLSATSTGWLLQTPNGKMTSEHVVIGLGPWSNNFVRRLGYSYPLFVKRGYHAHYAARHSLRAPTLDVERGYVLTQQRQGIRLTTGADLSPLDSAPKPSQVFRSERSARTLFDIGERLDSRPWVGNRPCCADMKPIIGKAPKHKGLWFNFAHGHQGFTLGPISARILADLMDSAAVDPMYKAFTPDRFP